MFEGMVEAWDVNNEMIHGSFFVDQSGDPGIRVEMFQRAAERSPELLLFVNDYNIIAGTEAATYTTLIQDLLDQGAPVSAIGVQVRQLKKLVKIIQISQLVLFGKILFQFLGRITNF